MSSRLIPQSKPNHEHLSAQIQTVRVSTAAKIARTYTLEHGGVHATGHSENALATSVVTGDMLQIFIAEVRHPTGYPVPDIVQMLSEHFTIEDAAHVALLYTLFSENDFDKIEQAFSRQGIHFTTIAGRRASFSPQVT